MEYALRNAGLYNLQDSLLHCTLQIDGWILWLQLPFPGMEPTGKQDSPNRSFLLVPGSRTFRQGLSGSHLCWSQDCLAVWAGSIAVCMLRKALLADDAGTWTRWAGHQCQPAGLPPHTLLLTSSTWEFNWSLSTGANYFLLCCPEGHSGGPGIAGSGGWAWKPGVWVCSNSEWAGRWRGQGRPAAKPSSFFSKACL